MTDLQPVPRSNGAEPDELDALFDFIPRPDHTTGQSSIVPAEQQSSETVQNAPTTRLADEDYFDKADGLGIDDEVKVRKRRAPQPKLDEDRLLSENGIPKLQRIAKDRLRFRGKGHEYSDVARLLMTYQLWLDGLYPKAKFLDGLAIIEKLGHKKRIQVMRRAWIDESRRIHHSSDDSDSDLDDGNAELIVGREAGISLEGGLGLFEANPEVQDRDLYSATPRPPGTGAEVGTRVDAIGEPDEDELDALLAEENTTRSGTAAIQPPNDKNSRASVLPPEVDEFADEMEAMADMGAPW